MDASAWVAAGAAAISTVSLVWVRRAANAAHDQGEAAKEQTAIQRQLRVDAAQPYIWVDIRPDDEQGGLMLLVIGNSGPTVATNVRVNFDPPLEVPSRVGNSRSADARQVLSRGIASLPPGRQLRWKLGVVGHVLQAFKESDSLSYKAVVKADGPFGAVEPLTYTVNLDDLRSTLGVPLGTPNGIAVAIKQLTEAVGQVRAEVHATRLALAPPEGEGESDE